MAAIVRRPRRGGMAFQVRWREDGVWQSDTFDTERKALRFKCDVEDAGNRWPPGWVPGYGYLAAAHEPEPPAEPAVTAFAELAERYLLTRTSASAYRLTRYRGMVRRLEERFPVIEESTTRRSRPGCGTTWTAGPRRRRSRTTTGSSEIAACGVAYREDRDLITLAVHTGLRWGEISALRVGDVDVGGRRLAVNRGWKRDGDGAWIIGPPKTARSRPTLSLAPPLVELLRPYLDRPAQAYLFGNSNGDPLRQNVFYEYRWQRAVALAGSRGLLKRPRFHDLRHTHVAWLIAGGTPLPKIQARLGHESIQTTIDVYRGLLADTDDGSTPSCPRPSYRLGRPWRGARHRCRPVCAQATPKRRTTVGNPSCSDRPGTNRQVRRRATGRQASGQPGRTAAGRFDERTGIPICAAGEEPP